MRIIETDIPDIKIENIEMSKVELLRLLDESVYDLVKREELGNIVSEAITKW